MDILELKKSQVKVIAAAVNQIIAIDQLANTGQFNRNITNFYFQSLFRTDSDDVNNILGNNEEYIDEAIKELANIIAHPNQYSNIYPYVKSLVELTATIATTPSIKTQISEFITKFKSQHKTFIISDTKQNTEIAQFFVEHIRPLSNPPMRIFGSKTYLIQEHNTSLIRTLLFSAIRLFYLYLQLNGPYENILDNIDSQFLKTKS